MMAQFRGKVVDCVWAKTMLDLTFKCNNKCYCTFWDHSLFDDGPTRYKKLRKSVSQFVISQFGKFLNSVFSKLARPLDLQSEWSLNYLTNFWVKCMLNCFSGLCAYVESSEEQNRYYITIYVAWHSTFKSHSVVWQRQLSCQPDIV